jgi:hypothetical protein
MAALAAKAAAFWVGVGCAAAGTASSSASVSPESLAKASIPPVRRNSMEG